ncbi:CDP-glycerol glycerophosphotransferase family protein [Metabacillus schmidteae]|uniref:CDP-glycerol glycerophosphotransferase family protein n=1 Tax=Metabacillus schmidteae TaxID=2730405 RepID=UPI00158E0A33|nr:CDP-glycerol glycerophosphotransferase family protein [Metabacillus schmidteae]
MEKKYTVGFYIETTFHYYVYESIINELIKAGINCHLVINDYFVDRREMFYMYQDVLNFLEKLDRNDIEAYTVSAIKDQTFKYDCMVSPYYNGNLIDTAERHVRTVYGLLAKEDWNYSWWNVFYDKILCYSEYDHERLNIFNSSALVGNPKFDKWFKDEIDNMKIVSGKFVMDDQKKTIVYAPTYGELSSIDDWIMEINHLQDQYNVIIKLHHGTSFRDSEDYRRDYIYKNFKNITMDQGDLFALFKLADFIITDNSSMIFESMLARKNILLLNPITNEPLSEADGGEYLLRKNLINLNKGENIEYFLNDSRLFEEQLLNVDYFMNNIYKLRDGKSGERAANEIINLLNFEADTNRYLRSLRNLIFRFEEKR